MALKSGESLAVLTREIHVRLLELSAGGCLVESDRRMVIGTIGRLRIQLGVEEYVDAIEVVRCQHIEGAGAVYHIGMRFLSTRRPHARSIRYAVEGHAAELFALTETTRVM